MKTQRRLLGALLLTLTLCSINGLTGCRQTLVLPADKVLVPMQAGKPYAPPFDGYFVPQDRMIDILNQLSAKDIFGTNTSK